MANITVTIPDASLTRVINGICNTFDYIRSIEGVENPPTKAQFAKSVIIEFIKKTVKNAEINTQTKTTENTVNSEIEGISIT